MKCFGIISYLPDGEVGYKRFELLLTFLQQIDEYFHLPVYILAQHWGDKVNYELPGDVTLFCVEQGLGIIKARIKLRLLLLDLDYDTYILSDDDTVLTCTQEGVNNYLAKIDENPGKVGMFHGDWLRLFAISKEMYLKMNMDFIRDYYLEKGELWDDTAYIWTYKEMFPDKFYSLATPGLTETFIPSELNPLSTWYKPEFNYMFRKTKVVIDEWVKSYRNSLLPT